MGNAKKFGGHQMADQTGLDSNEAMNTLLEFFRISFRSDRTNLPEKGIFRRSFLSFFVGSESRGELN